MALSWLTHKKGITVIPTARQEAHLKENLGGIFDLNDRSYEKISSIFPTEVIHINPSDIRVTLEGQGNRQVYQTLEQAKNNKLQFVPSPLQLASVLNKNELKPVRLIKVKNGYELVEGRLRYWAWVIAFSNEPLPCVIRDNFLRSD